MRNIKKWTVLWTVLLLLFGLAFAQNSRMERVVRDIDDNRVSGAVVYFVNTSTGDSLLATENLTKPGLYQRDNAPYGDYKVYVDGALQTQGVFVGTIRQRTFIETVDSDGDNLIETAGIEDNAINTVKLADGAVTTAKLANDAVTSSKIAANAVGATEIATGAVGSAELGAGAVGTTELADNAVTADKVATGAIGSLEIADNSVKNAELDNNAVATANILDGAITSAKIGEDEVESIHVAANSLDGSDIANESLDSLEIKDGGISWNDFSPQAQDSAKQGGSGTIADGSVTNAKLASNAVTAAKVADSTITGNKIATGAVTAANLATNSVTAAEIANNAVGTGEILDLAVTSAKMADGAKLGVEQYIGGRTSTWALSRALTINGTELNETWLEKFRNQNYVASLNGGNPQLHIRYDNAARNIIWDFQIQVRNTQDADVSISVGVAADTFNWAGVGSHAWVCAVKDSATLQGYTIADVDLIEQPQIYPLFFVLSNQVVWSAFDINYQASTKLEHLHSEVSAAWRAADDSVRTAQEFYRITHKSKYPFTENSSLVANALMPDSVFHQFIVYGDSTHDASADTAKAYYLQWILAGHVTFDWYITLIDSAETVVASWQSATDPGNGPMTVKLTPVGNSGVYAMATVDWSVMATNYLFGGADAFNARIAPENVRPYPGLSGSESTPAVTGTQTFTPDVSTDQDSSQAKIITPTNYDSERAQPYPVLFFLGTKADLSVGTGSKGGFFDTLNANGVIMVSYDTPDCWGGPRCLKIGQNAYDYVHRNLNAETSVFVMGVSRGFLSALNLAELNIFPIRGIISAAGVTDLSWAYSESTTWEDSIEVHYGFTVSAQLDSATKGYDPARRHRFVSGSDTLKVGNVPMLIKHGDADTTVPIVNATRFRDWLHNAGSHCI